MDGTQPGGKFSIYFPLYNDKQQNRADVTSSEGVVKHLVPKGAEGADKKIDQFEVKQATTSNSEFDMLYQKTSMVESSRLIMTNFRNSMEELSLVRALNLELSNKESKWTPVKVPVDFSDETIKHLIGLYKLNGSFFSRIWVIMDKETQVLIGIMDTSQLNSEGYSVITRHLLKKYTGKGLGSEALLSLFEHYSRFNTMKIPENDRQVIKIRTQESLFKMAEVLLPPSKVVEFQELFFKENFSDHSEVHRITDFFPGDIGPKVRVELNSLKRHC